MAEQTFQCRVITPEAQVYDGQVEAVVIPAHDGEIGILFNRAPLLCKLGPGRMRVRMGVLGVRLLTLETADIAEAVVHSFSPLRDFGGWGIRGNRQMKAYFFSGRRGVKVRTRRGKQYLVGSDRPERLAAVIGAALGTAQSGTVQ